VTQRKKQKVPEELKDCEDKEAKTKESEVVNLCRLVFVSVLLN
jgi:hypothetical protein